MPAVAVRGAGDDAFVLLNEGLLAKEFSQEE